MLESMGVGHLTRSLMRSNGHQPLIWVASHGMHGLAITVIHDTHPSLLHCILMSWRRPSNNLSDSALVFNNCPFIIIFLTSFLLRLPFFGTLRLKLSFLRLHLSWQTGHTRYDWHTLSLALCCSFHWQTRPIGQLHVHSSTRNTQCARSIPLGCSKIWPVIQDLQALPFVPNSTLVHIRDEFPLPSRGKADPQPASAAAIVRREFFDTGLRTITVGVESHGS